MGKRSPFLPPANPVRAAEAQFLGYLKLRQFGLLPNEAKRVWYWFDHGEEIN
jgi:hypothetical protein